MVEIMFAVGISTIVVSGVLAMFLTHIRAYHSEKLIREMQQNVRFALDSVARDLRMAGYGIPVSDSRLQLWTPWAYGVDSNPDITSDVGGGPDEVTMLAAFGQPIARLAWPADKNSTTLWVESGQGALVNTYEKSVLYLGRCEVARVVAKSGDVLTISGNPALEGYGLAHDHPVGTVVELVQRVTYSCRTGTNAIVSRPYLARDTHSGVVTQAWHQMVAADIEDLRVSRDGYAMLVELTGRTPEPVPDYTHPEEGDGYRRMTVSTRVFPRNSPLLRLRY